MSMGDIVHRLPSELLDAFLVVGGAMPGPRTAFLVAALMAARKAALPIISALSAMIRGQHNTTLMKLCW